MIDRSGPHASENKQSVSGSRSEQFGFGAIFLFLGGAFSIQLSQADLASTLNTTSADSLQGSLLLQALNALSYVFALITILRTRRGGAILKSAWMIMILPGIAVASTIWSVDPLLSFRKSISYSGAILFGLSMIIRLSVRDFIRVLILSMVAANLLSIVWVFVFPMIAIHQAADAWPYEGGHAGLWRGIFDHKTTLGAFSGLTIPMLLFYGNYAFSSRAIRWAMCVATSTCLIRSGAGGGVLIAVVTSISVIFFNLLRKVSLTSRLVAMFIAILLFVLFLYLLSSEMLSEIMAPALEYLGKRIDLTGRVPFWLYVINNTSDISGFGLGYVAGFSRYFGPKLAALTDLSFINAHNGYIEALIAFGYYGLILIVMALTLIAIKATRFALMSPLQMGSLSALPVSMVICVAFSSFIESVLTSPGNTEMIILASMVGMVAKFDLALSSRSSKMCPDRSYAPRSLQGRSPGL